MFVGAPMPSGTSLMVFLLFLAIFFFPFFFLNAGLAARFVFVVWLRLFLSHFEFSPRFQKANPVPLKAL